MFSDVHDNLGGKDWNGPHFADGETKAQKGEWTDLESLSTERARVRTCLAKPLLVSPGLGKRGLDGGEGARLRSHLAARSH